MDKKYELNVRLFKALSDTNRLMIVNMLSYNELCACKILEQLGITQPTLSHHMKILCDCDLVKGRKDGKWTHYSLNGDTVSNLVSFFHDITITDNNCMCKEDEKGCYD